MIRPVPLTTIILAVCARFRIDPAFVYGRSRPAGTVRAREAIVLLARRLTYLSYPELARGMGKAGHSTCVTMNKRGKRRALHDPRFARLVGEIHDRLEADSARSMGMPAPRPTVTTRTPTCGLAAPGRRAHGPGRRVDQGRGLARRAALAAAIKPEGAE